MRHETKAGAWRAPAVISRNAKRYDDFALSDTTAESVPPARLPRKQEAGNVATYGQTDAAGAHAAGIAAAGRPGRARALHGVVGLQPGRDRFPQRRWCVS